MKLRWWLVAGVAWGLAVVLAMALLGQPPPAILGGLESYPVACLTADLLTVDHIPFTFILLPLGLGMDVLVWTVGLALWLIFGGAWPGAALAPVGNLPALAWALVLVAVCLAGGAVTGGMAWLLRLLSPPR